MNDNAVQAGAFVWRKINELTGSNNESSTRAALAKLRRGISKTPGSIPELWGVTLDGLPEALLSLDGAPSHAEWAVHTALTLFALHQQGKDLKRQCMSKEGASLGTVVQGLIKSDEDEQRIKRRFDAAATADSLVEFSHHLRGLVQLLKAEDKPLDYPALTKDLYWFQFPKSRDRVRLRWGQDFYHKNTVGEKEKKGKDGNDNENM